MARITRTITPANPAIVRTSHAVCRNFGAGVVIEYFFIARSYRNRFR